MSYPYPIPFAQGNPYTFVAGPTTQLGSYVKPVDQFVGFTVDYSQLIPTPNIVGVWFKIRPGGSPQLIATNASVAANVLTFNVQGGIPGRTYDLTIISKGSGGGIRTHILSVVVPGGGHDECQVVQPPINNALTSPDGSVIVNTAPRFFVSGTPPDGANVMDQWYNSATGHLFSNASNGETANWVLISGGGGGGGSSGLALQLLDTIAPDGTLVRFPLTLAGSDVFVLGSNWLLVSVDGVWQEPTTQYTVAGNRITFAEAPLADARVFMLWFNPDAGL